jgi:hypothetical protein
MDMEGREGLVEDRKGRPSETKRFVVEAVGRGVCVHTVDATSSQPQLVSRITSILSICRPHNLQSHRQTKTYDRFE